MKEINEMTEKEAKDKLEQTRTKYYNCQVLLFGSILFAVTFMGLLMVETYLKAQLKQEVSALDKQVFDQSIQISNLKADTSYYRSEIILWKKLIGIK